MTFERWQRIVKQRRTEALLAAASLTTACHPDFSCEVMGTLPCPGYGEDASVVEGGSSHATEAEGGVSSTGSATSSDISGSVATKEPATETSESSTTTLRSETTLESSTGDNGACLPLSEEGCSSETPWCLGEGETNGDGGFAVEPRCVECEEDSHCQWPYVPQEQSGVCLDSKCTPCELGSNRGCGEDAPYCVAAGARAEAGDASVGQVTLTDVDGGVAETVECVACLSETDCSGGTPACVSGACVECESDAQCATAEASRCDTETHECVGCNAMGGCAHVEGTPACDVNAGRCVECTREEQSACDDGELGFDYACVTIPEHPGYHTCSDKQRGNSAQCTECVSDLQCLPGLKCVPETFGVASGDAGTAQLTGESYCMALEAELGDGKECGDNRPFIGSFDASSEGGAVGRYCKTRHATCGAYLTHGNGPDVIPAGEPGAGGATCFDHESCGTSGLNDGYCVRFTSNANRCTYECAAADDCPTDTTCNKTENVPPDVALRDRGVCSL